MFHAPMRKTSKLRSDMPASLRAGSQARFSQSAEARESDVAMPSDRGLLRASSGAQPLPPPGRTMLQRKCTGCEDEDKRLQTKLAVSEPGDEYEREADHVADRVMRMPGPSAESPSAAGPDTPGPRDPGRPRIQRLPKGDSASTEVESDFASRLGAGAPLDGASRAFFEPRFGHDFGSVRVHAGPQAVVAAARVRARAFTLGRDVVFGAGAYDPASESGKRLLAHELTHVVQQGADRGTSTIQRAAHDFEVRGKSQISAALSNFAFFTESSATLDAAETAKVDSLALPADDMLTLNGYTSEEDGPATQLAITNSRLDAVAARLVLKGHNPAKLAKVPLPSSGEGRIDYRRMRSVEILKPGRASTVPTAAAPATAACAGSNETNFKDAVAEAQAMIAKSVAALAPPIPASMTPLLTRFFHGWTRANARRIKGNLDGIAAQLSRLIPAANHQCGTIKYAGCESGSEAENMDSGRAAMMTMCPSFFDTGKSKKDRGGILLHEAAHGTPGLETKDKAYSHERLIEFLPIADALKNSDSYTLLVRLFDVPGSMTVGPAVPDPLTGGMTAPEETAAREAMAWMEKWLIWSYQEMSALYDTIEASIAGGAWTNTHYEETMGLAAPLFGLTVPPALPTKTDKVRVAAIYDRFHIMRSTEWSKAVTLNKIAAGAERWAPGPGGSVDLGPAFFADSPRGRLDRMLTAIAKATPDVSATFVAKYVTLADKIRTHRGGGAP
jgi:hypothetical protein